MAINEEERWQAKKSTVLERNSFMFKNSLMSDIKFVFPNDTIIPAHKYVLAISSSVFFSMFYSDETESRNTIEITDCDAAFFLNFLRFIYTDEVYFEDVDCAMKVWNIAEKYDVPLLARECVMFIDGNMNPAQSIDVLRHAREVNEKTLETACWEMIDHNAETISEDECFLRIEKEFLLSFIERSSLHIEETQLFHAINRWAVQRCKENNLACDGPNKRSVLGEDVLKNVRFSLMLPNQFTDQVVPKNILTNEEVIQEFVRFSQDYSEITRAASFCTRYSRIAGDSLNLQTGVQLSDTLTLKASKPVLLCGLQFVFEDSKETEGHLSLVLWRQGVKIKHLTAKSQAGSWNTGWSFFGENKVFFNRPISLDEDTCYTIELLGASSRSTKYYVRCSNTTGITQRASSDHYSRPTNSSRSTDVTFKFCGGLFKDHIPENPYFGLISKVLFQDFSTKQLSSSEDDIYSVSEELYEEYLPHGVSD